MKRTLRGLPPTDRAKGTRDLIRMPNDSLESSVDF